MHRLLYLLLLPLTTLAQPDSVIISGQIRQLSARLYRLSPNVVVARTNIVRGGSEQAFLAPLQADGRFRVAVPIIYPLEEMTLQFGGGNQTVTTSFLAAAGQLGIDVDNDSLFIAAVPFRFSGVNAQVNQQHAQYEAAAYRRQQATKSERERTIRRASNAGSLSQSYQLLLDAATAPLDLFAAEQSVFPLVRDWIRANAQYDAAAFVFDQAINTQQSIPTELLKTMLSPSPNLLTPARATAMDRLGTYTTGRITPQLGNRSVKVQLLASLIIRYGQNLTTQDQERLTTMRETGSARTAELRYLAKLLDRNPDTLNRLMLYEQTVQVARTQFDSSTVDYLKAYLLTSSLPQAILKTVGFLSDYIQPQIGDNRLRQSFNNVVGQALRDTTAVRMAHTQYQAQAKRTGINYGPIADGIYATTGTYQSGNRLVQEAIDRNRGKVIYLIIWSPGQENGRQLARDAQPLLDIFSDRDLALLYLSVGEADDELWLESVVRNRLRGDHVHLTGEQALDVAGLLDLYTDYPARIITPQGKVFRRQALLPTPTDFPKLINQLRDQLK